MDQKPQIIRRGRKFDQVLAGARAVFFRLGYERASVDDIAAEAGVSKATLYSYFPDKRLVFVEVAKAEFLRHADEAEALIVDCARVEEVLEIAARRIVGFMASDFGKRIYRMVVAEAENFPTVAAGFYQSGPVMVRTRIVKFLREAVARGQLRIDDFDLAADQFAALCKGCLQDQLMLCPEPCCTPAEVDRVITGAVAMFMASYGVRT